MTDETTGSLHLLRPSISGALPPLPEREGQRLRISLAFTRRNEHGSAARIHTYPAEPIADETTQHDDLREGDTFTCRFWTLQVCRISADGVEVRLLPEVTDA